MRIQLLNLRRILSRSSTLVEVEVEEEVEEDKEVVEVEIPTKANNRIKSLMTQTGVHMEEEIFEAGGAREDTKIIKEMMWMQTTMVVGHVENQATLKGIAHGIIKAIGGSKITMHPVVIKMIQRGYLLCNI